MSFYMKVDGLKGSVTARNHTDWMQLESFDFGTHRSIHLNPGHVTDRETSLATVGDFRVTKHVDASSPYLLVNSCTGKSLGTVVIHACHSGNASDPYLVYTLSEVILSQYEISGNAPESTDQLLESLHLNFTQVQMQFVPRDASNSAQNPIVTGFNLATATKL